MVGEPIGGMATGMERETATLGVLERISRAWARDLTPQQGLEVLGRELERMLPCDRVYLLGVKRRFREVTVVGVYRPASGGLMPGQVLAGDTQTIELVEGGLDVTVCSDTGLWANGLERLLAGEDIRSCISLVLRWQDNPQAVLVVGCRRELVYAPEAVQILHRMAPTIAAQLCAEQPAPAAPSADEAFDDDRERMLMSVVGGIAHNFNNTLACLLGGLELMRDCDLNAEARDMLERMEARVVDSGNMVKALQHFAAKEPPECLVDIELRELVDEVIKLTRPVWETTIRATGRRVDIRHLAWQGLRVRGNRRELREAIINVLFNALQAMPHGGVISITEGADKLNNYVEVSDPGEGMPPEVVKRVREPFFTTEPQRRQGLGLSVTSGILRRHGGDLTIKSQPGKGTTVRLSLLAADPAVG